MERSHRSITPTARTYKNYSYDDAFRITGITDAGSMALSVGRYGYDNLDRLNSATSTAVTQGWTYDANGNRLTESGTAPSTLHQRGPLAIA